MWFQTAWFPLGQYKGERGKRPSRVEVAAEPQPHTLNRPIPSGTLMFVRKVMRSNPTDTPTVKQGPDSHFHSVHGYLGILTSVILLVQYVFGFLMWGVPGVFGGIDNAKALWKYHRMSGYLLFLLILATVISAVWTDFNVNVLNIRAWTVIVAVVLIVVGVYPRLHPRKFGFNIGRQ